MKTIISSRAHGSLVSWSENLKYDVQDIYFDVLHCKQELQLKHPVQDYPQHSTPYLQCHWIMRFGNESPFSFIYSKIKQRTNKRKIKYLLNCIFEYLEFSIRLSSFSECFRCSHNRTGKNTHIVIPNNAGSDNDKIIKMIIELSEHFRCNSNSYFPRRVDHHVKQKFRLFSVCR